MQKLSQNEMTESTNMKGKTTVAPEVLLTIARLTTLQVEGVSRMANLPTSVNRLFQHGSSEGVCIEIKDDVVTIDLFVILKEEVNLREVSRTVQREVARSISEMVGMQVGRINIHVEDIDFSEAQSQEESAGA